MKIIKCDRVGKICSDLPRCRRVEAVEAAAQVIREGGLVVYPTDTIYGLGADPFNAEAVGKVFEAKERPESAPISVAVSDVGMLKKVARVSAWQERVIETLAPRPITFILPKKKAIPRTLTAGREVVGVRIPNHMFALAMINAAGPVTTTSANLHDGHEPKTIRSAIRQLGEAVDIYIDCGKPAFCAPSTVLDLTSGTAREARIIRKGAADPGEILDIVATIQ